MRDVDDGSFRCGAFSQLVHGRREDNGNARKEKKAAASLGRLVAKTLDLKAQPTNKKAGAYM